MAVDLRFKKEKAKEMLLKDTEKRTTKKVSNRTK